MRKAVTRRRRRSPLSFVLIVVLALLTAACSSVPEQTANAAKALPDQIEQTRQFIATQQAQHDQLLQKEQFAFIKAYSPEEQHTDRFAAASSLVDQAQAVYDNRVQPLVDNYDAARLGELDGAISEANAALAEARVKAKEPAEWAETLVRARTSTPALVAEAERTAQALDARHAALTQSVMQAKDSFPNQRQALDQRLAPFSALQAESTQALGVINAETADERPNYAAIAESAKTISRHAETFGSDENVLRSQLGELPVRETHTLVDIKVDPEISISRTSWDEYYDYPTEHEFDYPSVPVDLATADYFAQFGPDQVLATAWGDNFKLTDGIDLGQWQKLNIDPFAAWPSGDNAAEYSLGELEETYCHKLRVLKDGRPDSSGRPDHAQNHCSQYDTQADIAKGIYWVESDELRAEDIGMDVYSKGFGTFASEATTEAAPPGMVYVGDTTTGEWRTDSNGNSFWHYYGQYAFFSNLIGGSNPYHYRSEFDEWDRDYRYRGKPYYSKIKGREDEPRYGGSSAFVAARFPGSTFTRSGLADATLRNAGPVARSGGPGGGGK